MSRSAPGESAVIPATDGVPLAGRVFEPPGAAELSVLLLPGIGVRQRVFRHIGPWLATRGVRVVTVDYRGIGESEGAPGAGETATLRTWAERDAVGALRFVEQRASGGPVVLIGHSFGGQVLGFSDEFRRVRAAILVGSQFGNARYWDAPRRFAIAAYWYAILPAAASVFARVPGWTGIGEALPRGVAREWSLWGRTPDWLLSHVPGAAERYAAFDRPLRAYGMSDDPIAPPRAVGALLERFRATKVERVDLVPRDFGLAKLGHLGVFRPGPTERVWEAMLEFARGC